MLRAAAGELRRRRLELAALEVRECAKPWPEADADVCEAIDFLEYYAAAAVEVERGRELLQAPGERNTMRRVPRGVAAVIAPWNFPLAIPCGMTSAALATGNSVVLKPAEQSPATAAALVDALHTAGVPPDALGLLPGLGEAGAALVRDPRVHLIAFTGSSAVGLEIIRTAAETPEGQNHVKRVIAEMGGKNCVIVDSDADLDDAVPAIVESAFAYGGQKCSAASRVLAHEAIAETLIERVAGAVETLAVGQADDFATDVPPLIEREARERLERLSEIAAADGRVAAGGRAVPDAGWFARPTVVTDLPARLEAAARGGVRAAAHGRGGRRDRRGARRRRRALVRAHRRPVLAQPGDDRTGRAADPDRQPLREPLDHRRDGRPPAVRRQPPLGHRLTGRRARLPDPVHRTAGGQREHDAPRARHRAGLSPREPAEREAAGR